MPATTTQRHLAVVAFLLLVSALSVAAVLATDPRDVGPDIAAYSSKVAIFYLFIGAIIVTGIMVGSILRAFAFIFPLSLAVYRPLIDFGYLVNGNATTSVRHSFLYEFDLLLVLFAVAVLAYYKRVYWFGKRSPIKYYLYLTLFAVLSISWAVDRGASVYALPVIFSLLFSFVVFSASFTNDANVKAFIMGLITLCIAESAFALLQLTGYTDFGLVSRGVSVAVSAAGSNIVRARGTLSHADLAFLLVTVGPLAYSYFLLKEDGRRADRIVSGILALVFLVGCAMTRHRLQSFALLFGLTAVTLKAARTKALRFPRTQWIGLGVATVAFLFVLTYGAATKSDVYLRQTWAGRLLTYYAAVHVFWNTHGWGVGLNNFLAAPFTRSVLGYRDWFIVNGITAHDDVLRIMSELGVVGLILFLVFLAKIVKMPLNSERNFNVAYGIKVSIMSLIITSVADGPFNKPIVLIIVGGYLAVLAYINAKRAGRMGGETTGERVPVSVRA